MGAREDAAREELITKLRALAKKRGTTPDGLFKVYDADGGGSLSRAELDRLLSDADVGNFLTRGLYVQGIFDALDLDKGGSLTRAELDGVLKQVPAPTGKRPTTAQLKEIGRKLWTGDLDSSTFDWSKYTQAEIAIIESENLRVSNLPDASTLQTGDDLGVTDTVPPIPRAPSAPSATSSGAAAVLVAIAALVLLRG